MGPGGIFCLVSIGYVLCQQRSSNDSCLHLLLLNVPDSKRIGDFGLGCSGDSTGTWFLDWWATASRTYVEWAKAYSMKRSFPIFSWSYPYCIILRYDLLLRSGCSLLRWLGVVLSGKRECFLIT